MEPLDLYLEKSANQGATRQVLRGYSREERHYREILRNRFRRRGQPRLNLHSRPVLKTSRDSKLEIIETPTAIDARKESGERLALFNALWKEYKEALEAFYASK